MRRLFLPTFAVLPFAFLSACNSARDAALESIPFDAKEAAYIKAQGAARIEGHAFLRDKTGTSTHDAAGEVVRLIPATDYARARMAHFYGGAKFVAAGSIPKVEPDPDYVAYTRTTTAESNGRFAFDHVAPGQYFLTTQLIWKPKDSFLSQGGAMVEDVTVTGKESGPIKVVLSGN